MPPLPRNLIQEQQNFRNVNQPPPPVKKKSGGKGLAIGAGLFALLILLVGAGAGGWYVYKNYVAVENPPADTRSFPVGGNFARSHTRTDFGGNEYG